MKRNKPKEKIKGIDVEETSRYLMRKMNKKQMAIEIISYRLAFNVMRETAPFMQLANEMSKRNGAK